MLAGEKDRAETKEKGVEKKEEEKDINEEGEDDERKSDNGNRSFQGD